MSYARIAKAVAETPWAITREKLDEIEAILTFHMEGHKFTPEELRARLGDPTEPSQPAKRGSIAVIPLQGVISHRMGGMSEMSGGMSTERFAKMFREAMADESVSAIVADVNSPGGTIAGVTELFNEILAARGKGKKLYAHINAFGASAAYWLSAAFDEIWATPSATVGGIGIIASHIDTSKADEQSGITRTTFSAGKYKAEGQDGPLNDEAKAAIQKRINEAYGVMKADISGGRGVSPDDIENGFGQGRVVSAKEAKKLGMIDKIATFDDLVGKLSGRKASIAGMRAEDEATEIEAEEQAAPLTAADRDVNALRDIRDRIERF